MQSVWKTNEKAGTAVKWKKLNVLTSTATDVPAPPELPYSPLVPQQSSCGTGKVEVVDVSTGYIFILLQSQGFPKMCNSTRYLVPQYELYLCMIRCYVYTNIIYREIYSRCQIIRITYKDMHWQQQCSAVEQKYIIYKAWHKL